MKKSLVLLLSLVLIASLGSVGVMAQEGGGDEEYSWQNPKGKLPEFWSDEQTDCAALGLAADPPWTIGVANASLGNSWRVQMIKELEAAAARDDRIGDLIITNADGDLSKQISDIDDMIAAGVDAIMILPLSPDGIALSVEDAYNEGIVTIVFNDFVNTDKFHSILWVDEYKFGYIGGAWLNEQLGGEGKIVLLEGIAGMGVSDLRSEGALDALGDNIEVLARQPAGWAYDQAKVAMEDFISAYPGEINGVYSQGGAMSLAALDALQAAGMDLVPVPGEGYNGFLKFWASHLEDGFSSVAPDEPTWQSAAALDVAISCLEGQTIDKWTELPLPVITDETVNDYARFDCPDGVWANTLMDPEQITELYDCQGTK
jgi:ribose transport system substrate-binding protein